MPFQRSAIAPPPGDDVANPTASHELAATHDRLVSPLAEAPLGMAASRGFQLLPFHRSANGRLDELATASHALAETHETAWNSRADPPAGLGEQAEATAVILKEADGSARAGGRAGDAE